MNRGKNASILAPLSLLAGSPVSYSEKFIFLELGIPVVQHTKSERKGEGARERVKGEPVRMT